MKTKYIGSICLSGGSVSVGLHYCPEALNHEALAEIKKREAGYIIAAPVCYLSEEWLDAHRIVFLKVGRDIQASRFRPSARWKCTVNAMEEAANRRIMDRAEIRRKSA